VEVAPTRRTVRANPTQPTRQPTDSSAILSNHLNQIMVTLMVLMDTVTTNSLTQAILILVDMNLSNSILTISRFTNSNHLFLVPLPQFVAFVVTAR